MLLADDNLDDRLLFEEPFFEMMAYVELKTVKDGDELMSSLLKPDATIPDILFLDLNMPRMNGKECLEVIRRHPFLKDLRIVIYSTHLSKKEADYMYELGANLYIKKPNTVSELRAMMEKVLAIDWDDYTPQPKRENFVWEN